MQNTSTTPGDTANVTVTYKPGNYTQNATIQPGNKFSFSTCATSGISAPYIGAAVVESVGAPIVAIGKMDGGGQYTAFTGFSAGSAKVALPYVRYANNTHWLQGWQRTYIAIQNVGAAIPAGQHIYVRYINPDGNEACVHDYTGGLDQYAKFNSNATNCAGVTQFGYLGGQAGGGVIVEGPAGSQLAVLARVQTRVTSTISPGEDYNGVPCLNRKLSLMTLAHL